MGRKKKYIAELDSQQRRSLEKGYKTGDSHLTRRKCQAILLSYSGKSVDELALLLRVTKQSIYLWYKAWEAEGIKGLELKPGRGRKPKLKENIPMKQQM
jgi:transposase